MFGGKTQIEVLSRTQLLTLVFSAGLSYFVLITCGTLGAPKSIQETISTCVFSEGQCLQTGLRICEIDDGSHIENGWVNLHLKFQGEAGRNWDSLQREQTKVSVSVHDSDSQSFLYDCLHGIQFLKKYKPVDQQENLVVEITDKEWKKFAKIPTITKEYRMIEVFFDQQSSPEPFSQISQISLMQSFRNNRLTRYETIFSIILFVLSAMTLCNFTLKLKQVSKNNNEIAIGEVQKLIQFALYALVLFNLPYKYSLTTNQLTAVWDTFVNSGNIAIMLVTNLVIVDALTIENAQGFYTLKVGMGVILMISLSIWMYSDYLADLSMFKNDFKTKPSAENSEDNAYMLVLVTFTLYLALLFRYFHKAFLKTSSFAHNSGTNNRWERGKIRLWMTTAFIASVMIVIPYQSQTVQYMNQNGLVNIYVLLISFLFEPYLDTDIQKYTEEGLEEEQMYAQPESLRPSTTSAEGEDQKIGHSSLAKRTPIQEETIEFTDEIEMQSLEEV